MTSHPAEESCDDRYNDMRRFLVSKESKEQALDIEVFQHYIIHMTKWSEVVDFQQERDIVYEIDVTNKGKRLWTVKRTYNEFKWLEDKVRSKARDLPPFPGEKRFGKFSPKFLETRKILLRQWAQACARPENLHRVLAIRSFCEIAENGRHCIPPSHSGINKRAIAVVQALQDYDDGDVEHLVFTSGDLISIVDKSPDNRWYKGKIGSTVGWLPCDIVNVISESGLQNATLSMNRLTLGESAKAKSNHIVAPPTDAKRHVIALYDYTPPVGVGNQLLLLKNDIVRLDSEPDSDWWFGNIVKSSDPCHIGTSGYFPNNYVEDCPPPAPQPQTLLNIPPPPPVNEIVASIPPPAMTDTGGSSSSSGANPMSSFANIAMAATFAVKTGSAIPAPLITQTQGQVQPEPSPPPPVVETVSVPLPMADPSPSSIPPPSSTSSSFSSPSTCTATFDYTSTEQSDLSFKKGDIITVTDASDPEWWIGILNSRKGTFPVAYVTPNLDDEKAVDDIPPPPTEIPGISHSQPMDMGIPMSMSTPSSSNNIPVAPHPPSTGMGMGSMAVPPPVQAQEIAEPENMLDADIAAEIDSLLNLEEGEEAGEALYSFVGEGPGEISITAGEKLIIFEDSDGWTRGQNSKGDIGHFPSSFIRK